MATLVKACPKCGAQFELAKLASDPDVIPIGMQFADPEQHSNLYYFNHTCPGCGTTFVIAVEDFLPLIDEPVPDLAKAGSEDCGGHCLNIGDLSHCGAPCRYAPFRRFLLKMRAQNEAARRASRCGAPDVPPNPDGASSG